MFCFGICFCAILCSAQDSSCLCTQGSLPSFGEGSTCSIIDQTWVDHVSSIHHCYSVSPPPVCLPCISSTEDGSLGLGHLLFSYYVYLYCMYERDNSVSVSLTNFFQHGILLIHPYGRKLHHFIFSYSFLIVHCRYVTLLYPLIYSWIFTISTVLMSNIRPGISPFISHVMGSVFPWNFFYTAKSLPWNSFMHITNINSQINIIKKQIWKK